MPKLQIAATLLLATLIAAPAAGQEIPDEIPDVPGESPADRMKERFLERHADLLSRLFSTGTFDVAPVGDPGVAGLEYQANMRLGLDFRSGDALFVTLSNRRVPVTISTTPADFEESLSWYGGVGYAVSGTRVLGDSRAGRRSALNVELGLWSGPTSATILDLAPTYEIFARDSWSVPVGVRFSMGRIDGPNGAVTRSFVGLSLGAKWHFFARSRVE